MRALEALERCWATESAISRRAAVRCSAVVAGMVVRGGIGGSEVLVRSVGGGVASCAEEGGEGGGFERGEW